MTIDNVIAEDLIDPAWGNAVADQLNRLPKRVVRGSATVTNTSGDSTTISFGHTFPTAPYMQVTVIAIGTGQEWSSAVRALSTTGFAMRTYLNGAAHTGSVTFHWQATEV